MRQTPGILAACALVAACGGSSPPPTTPAKQGGDRAEVALPDVPFDTLDHDQKVAFMKQKVVPAMKPVFQNHDAKDYAQFGCVTCHGDQAKAGHFEMPNRKLPRLDFEHLDKFDKADLEWMGKEVMPTMAKLLGRPVFTHEDPTGFGCLGCHMKDSP